jgi:hypothetical protein
MMKQRLLLLTLASVFAISACNEQPKSNQTVASTPPAPSPAVAESARTRVPAHFEKAPPRESLSPTLNAARFTGKARQAYQVAGEIPQTLAQLPCYCHCDRGMGHKSLHSCFEDDHAAHCAVCVDEALMAYRLEKSEGLTAAQVRERIIAQYSGK